MSNFTVRMETGDVICEQPYILNEATGCVDWSTLLWGVPLIITGGAGTAYFTPDSVPSASWTCGAGCPDDATDTGICLNQATVIHNGPACNCQITTHVVKVCNPADIILVNMTMAVTSSLFGFLPIDGIAPFYDYAAYAPGTYDEVLPFTLPATGGVNDTITLFQINCQIPAFIPTGALGMAIDVTATISNV